ncbi:MAG: DUF167 domain-containing protein [Treponema sp.]|jgi:uncharacterized protein (TIGR00251 family)|nr:DUF167 domain-containing protein [Treponema sp.]
MAETSWLSIRGASILLEVKAQPGAGKTEIAGTWEGRLKVRLAAAPEDGKANAELCRFLAGVLGCARTEVAVLRGQKSRLKTVEAPLSCRAQAEALILRFP